MKIRSGFVSNSSSSSFILATAKDNKKSPIKITIECNLKDIIEDTIETEKQWVEYLSEHCCYGESFADQLKEDEWLRKKYEKGIKQLKAGKILLVGNCSNEDDDAVSQFIFDNKLKGHIDETKYSIVEDAMH
jgi:hypothetical protein